MISCINCTPETSSLLSENRAVSGYFLSWISTEKSHKADKLLQQAESVEKIIKKRLPTVIFDKTFSLTESEINYFSKYPFIRLTEPSLITRKNFTYLPNWVKCLNIEDVPLNKEDRNITILYKGKLSDRIKSFEKYYLEVKKYWPDFTISYNSNDLIKAKESEYASLGIEKTSLGYKSAQYTIIIGSEQDYSIGYLDPYIFDAIQNNCVPIIAEEHRFYRALQSFSGYTFNMYNNIYIGEILEFYRNVFFYYHEMTDISFSNSVFKLLSV